MKFLISEKLSQHKYKTPEGYLVCIDAILARTGKQSYRRSEVFADGDDEIIEIDRRPEEVFSAQTLASFENKPITVEHPDEDVNSENYKDYAVGFVRDVHRGVVDGQEVILGTLVITDAQTIEEIENGEHTDLSCGYDCDIVDEANPQQRNIRGNHVALCAEGRAGNARIVDSKKVKDAKKYYFRVVITKEPFYRSENTILGWSGNTPEDAAKNLLNKLMQDYNSTKFMNSKEKIIGISIIEAFDESMKHINFDTINMKITDSQTVKDETKKKAIDYYGNNGLLNFIEMSETDAENLAKQKSINSPGRIFWVAYNDVTNPISGIYWKNGKSYNEFKQALNDSKVKDDYQLNALSLEKIISQAKNKFEADVAYDAVLKARKQNSISEKDYYILLNKAIEKKVILDDSIKDDKNTKVVFVNNRTKIVQVGTQGRTYAQKVGSSWYIMRQGQTLFRADNENDAYNHVRAAADINDSIKDVNPREGETKEEFISRFMSETKEEYPDEKQRFAVANSYWEKKDMKDEMSEPLWKVIKNYIEKNNLKQFSMKRDFEKMFNYISDNYMFVEYNAVKNALLDVERMNYIKIEDNQSCKDDDLDSLRKMIREEEPRTKQELRQIYNKWAEVEHHGAKYEDEFRRMCEEFKIEDSSCKDDNMIGKKVKIIGNHERAGKEGVISDYKDEYYHILFNNGNSAYVKKENIQMLDSIKDAHPLVSEVAEIIKPIESIFDMRKDLEQRGFKVEFYDGVLWAMKNGKKVMVVSKNRVDVGPDDIVQGNYAIGLNDAKCNDDNILGRKVIIRPRDVRMNKYVDRKGVIFTYEGTNYDDIVEVKLDNGEYVEVKFDEIKFLDSKMKDAVLTPADKQMIDDVISTVKIKTVANIIDALNEQIPGFVGSYGQCVIDYINSKGIKDSKVKDSYDIRAGAIFKEINPRNDFVRYIKVLLVKDGRVTSSMIIKKGNQYETQGADETRLDLFINRLSGVYKQVQTLYDSKMYEIKWKSGKDSYKSTLSGKGLNDAINKFKDSLKMRGLKSGSIEIKSIKFNDSIVELNSKLDKVIKKDLDGHMKAITLTKVTKDNKVKDNDYDWQYLGMAKDKNGKIIYIRKNGSTGIIGYSYQKYGIPKKENRFNSEEEMSKYIIEF